MRAKAFALAGGHHEQTEEHSVLCRVLLKLVDQSVRSPRIDIPPGSLMPIATLRVEWPS